MKDIRIYFGPDGIAREYDDTYDITIHCATKEEQNEAIETLTNLPRWRVGKPPEGMAKHVLVTLKWDVGDYETTELDYGVDVANGGRFAKYVTAWQPLPKPYKDADTIISELQEQAFGHALLRTIERLFDLIREWQATPYTLRTPDDSILISDWCPFMRGLEALKKWARDRTGENSSGDPYTSARNMIALPLLSALGWISGIIHIWPGNTTELYAPDGEVLSTDWGYFEQGLDELKKWAEKQLEGGDETADR